MSKQGIDWERVTRTVAMLPKDIVADTLRLSISTAYHFRPKDDIGVAFWIMTRWQDLMCLTVGHNEETRRRLLAVALAAQRPGWRALFKHNPKHTQTK